MPRRVKKEVAERDEAMSGSGEAEDLWEPGTLDELEEWDGCPGSSSDGSRRAAGAALPLPASSGAAAGAGAPAGSRPAKTKKRAAPAGGAAIGAQKAAKVKRDRKAGVTGKERVNGEWTESDDEDETANVGDMMPWDSWVNQPPPTMAYSSNLPVAPPVYWAAKKGGKEAANLAENMGASLHSRTCLPTFADGTSVKFILKVARASPCKCLARKMSALTLVRGDGVARKLPSRGHDRP